MGRRFEPGHEFRKFELSSFFCKLSAVVCRRLGLMIEICDFIDMSSFRPPREF